MMSVANHMVLIAGMGTSPAVLTNAVGREVVVVAKI